MFTIEYLKPMKRNFRNREKALKFIHQQYKIIRFLEKRNGVFFNLQIPQHNIETMRVGYLRKDNICDTNYQKSYYQKLIQ